MIHNIKYNSQKEKLTIPEYGRNVQNLIKHAKTIENDEERQHFVNAIIDLMHQMNPAHRNNSEYREKLWRHLFRIADFDINVTPPSGDIPTPESTKLEPANVEYSVRDRQYRHYGNHVKTMIAKAIEMEDEEKRTEFAETIGAYMKLAYRTWSRDHYVSDEIIRNDLKKLSNGVLIVGEDKSLDGLASKVRIKPKPTNNHSSRGKRQKGRPNNNHRRRR